MRLHRTLTPIVFILFLFIWPILAHADFQAGLDAYNQGDYATALKEWRPLAEQGDATAQFNLGVMYNFGQGVPQDYQEAVRWYRLAAEQGYAPAQFNLGFLYDKSLGVPQDYAQAREWYLKAAEQGGPHPQFALGNLYAKGEGVAQDYVQAHMWINLAAAQGLEEAANARDYLANKMTPEQLAEAQRLASEWQAQHQE